MSAALARSNVVPASLEAIDDGEQSGVRELAIVPPHDLDAEAAVLSAVMLDPAALGRVEDFLLPTHFYSEAHRRIYEAALEVKAAGSPVDEQTVGSRLKERGRLQQVGGMPYIAAVMASSPAVANVRAHAATVFDRWRVRETMLACERASIYGYGVADAQPYIESVAVKINDLARQRLGAPVERTFEVLARLVRQLNEGARAGAEGAKGRGIPTGIRSYDEQTLGLFAGQKTTIIAPPRVGKTAFALQIAINVANAGIGVAFFSTEMTRDELGIRQLAHLASVDSRRIQMAMQRPTFSAEEWQRITLASSQAGDIRPALHVFDDPSQTADDICSKAKALHEQSVVTEGAPLGLVIVDYVQNLRPSPSVERRPQIEQIRYSTIRLKNLAQELKLPVIELAQSKNIEVDKAKGCRPRPQLGEGADCFQIERSANNVVYLWRPRERDGSHVKAVCVKQRGGEEWELDFRFYKALSRFEDLPHGPMNSPSRQYVELEPPAGRFDDDDAPNMFAGDR